MRKPLTGPLRLPYPVDWTHPDNAGLKLLLLGVPGSGGGASWVDMTGRTGGLVLGTGTAAPTWSGTTAGMLALNTDGVNDTCTSAADPFHGDNPAKNWTIGCVVTPLSTTGEQVVFGHGDDNGTTGTGYFWEINAGTWQLLVAGVVRVNTSVTAVVGTRYVLAATANGAGTPTISVYVNGVASGSSVTPVNAPDATIGKVTAGWQSTAGRYAKCWLERGTILHRTVDAGWAARDYAWSRNPALDPRLLHRRSVFDGTAAAAPSGGPFPFYTRRKLNGGLIGLCGGC